MKASNLANINLIKRYNYYSMRILESMEENSSSGVETAAAAVTVGTAAKKPKLLNEEIKDLEREESISLRGAALNLVHIDRYFYAPRTAAQKQSPISQALEAAAAAQNNDLRRVCETSLSQAVDWNMNIRRVFTPYPNINFDLSYFD